jgi:mannitol 2-dehydrogenase
MVALNTANMDSITSVPTPPYERDAITVGIVHFGVGNFHRSHQAMYIDRLMAASDAHEWGICGVGVLPSDALMRDVMGAQDCLYTVVARHPDGSLEPRVVGSIVEYIFAPDDPESVLLRLTDPAVRIVSLTITEGGYFNNPATGSFDGSDPSVVHDLQNPNRPNTVFGFIVEGLRRRRAAGIEPFTVLSCDNLQGNGSFARQAVIEFARIGDPSFADWIEKEIAFPNCMVDRITPATTPADRDALRQHFGVDDLWPVPAEPFSQWIVEDHFPNGRPALEAVGVQFVPDVTPYELMKLRLLNASHQAIAYLGALQGYVLVDETMRDDTIHAYLAAYMRREAVPTLVGVEGIDLDAYIDTLLGRFSNPMMRDTLLRLATDGGNRMATFALPTLRANLDASRPIGLGALMVAAWAVLWERIAAGTAPPMGVPDDIMAEAMLDAAGHAAEDPTAFITIRRLFGDLSSDPRFSSAYVTARDDLTRAGVTQAIKAALH